jgi:precorrin-6B methylase 2
LGRFRLRAGAFTLALAELIGPSGQIHSVDRDRRALEQQERAMRGCFPATAAPVAPITMRLLAEPGYH